ncbi:MAG: Rad52/Rad22 family DNA repair protein [Oculatellaceae cyanobacterium bins.114]|nr:Rad52/Rad22 family DNA repair protein [Oculatellaceae cyanobacterium bins.114]
MTLSEIFPELTAKFEPQEHKKRTVPGGGDWYFVPWQTIRARLNRVCPDDWTNVYSDLTFVEGYCIIVCTLTICGVSHQGIGSTQIEILNAQGKNTAYGDPIERATADAFKNAAEQFGIAAYLDAQSDPSKKQAFFNYVSGRTKAAA